MAKSQLEHPLFKLARETSIALFVNVFGGIFVGSILGIASETIFSFAGLIILVPAISLMRGNISGIFSSHLSTGLHLGTVFPRVKNNSETFKEILVTIGVLSTVTPIGLGILAFIITSFFGVESFPLYSYILVSFLAGILAATVQTGTTILLSFTVFRSGLDPDVMVFPITAAIGDSVTIFSLLASVMILGSFGLLGI